MNVKHTGKYLSEPESKIITVQSLTYEESGTYDSPDIRPLKHKESFFAKWKYTQMSTQWHRNNDCSD